jgi:hypothetical protein
MSEKLHRGPTLNLPTLEVVGTTSLMAHWPGTLGGKETSMPTGWDKIEKAIAGRRYYFFLNPYEHAAFTKCPNCETKTKLRKFPLVIHIKPEVIFVLNKKCRYCTNCELIIVRQSELENLMWVGLEDKAPEIVGNDYSVFGTLEKRAFRRHMNTGNQGLSKIIKLTYVFKDVWEFKVVEG